MEDSTAGTLDLTRRIGNITLHAPSQESASYVVCDNEHDLGQLKTCIQTVIKSASSEQKGIVFLDCEGRDLGRVGGRLGLVQLGIENDIYLVDVIAFPETIPTVKDILENPVLEKVVWDGRSDYSELWHGHEIRIDPVIDLQLVQAYKSSGGYPGRNGFISLTGMATAFSKLSLREQRDAGIDLHRLSMDEIKEKHRQDETDFWVSRPLTDELLLYASFDIVQLRTLYKSYCSSFGRYPHIAIESKRYVELYRDRRRPTNQWYIEHGVLPQEILERSATNKALYDGKGTKECGACKRDLHQDSFLTIFKNDWRSWLGEYGPLCHTCRAAKRFKDNPRPRPRDH